MRWLMLCREPRLYSCRRLEQACRQQGIALDILDPNRMLLSLGESGFDIFYHAGEIYDKNRPEPTLLPDYQGVLPRFGTGSTETGCNVLCHFEAKGVAVLNQAAAVGLARNKWQSLQRLAAQGLPVPKTVFGGHLVAAKSQMTAFGFPMIAKVTNGSQGQGVMLFETLSAAESVLATFQQLNRPYLCQRFVPEAKGRDIRAFVLGEKVIAAMQRQSRDGEFRANIHQGGTAEAIKLSEAEQALAITAAKTVGLELAGVDFIRSNQGLLILEVNAVPGFEGLEQSGFNDIAEQIVAYFKAKIVKKVL